MMMMKPQMGEEVEMFSSKKRTQGRSNIYLQRFEGQHPLEKVKTCSVGIILQEEMGPVNGNCKEIDLSLIHGRYRRNSADQQ